MFDYLIEEVGLADVREFVETHHYSKSVAGLTPSYCFRIMFQDRMFGVAIFGIPAMKQTIDCYGENGTVNMVELRRFVMIDEAPRNSESYCLSRMFRTLKKKGVERILSYSDPNYGHVGTIYKAVGFRCLGQTSPINVVWYRDRKVRPRNYDQYRKWSTRSINRYQNYQDKSTGLFPYAQELRTALLEGTAVRKREAGKFIYVLDLTQKHGDVHGRANPAPNV
jgi:hypothetical protein